MNKLTPLALGLALGGLSTEVLAQHYPIGVEGLKAASLPPPGLYLRDYNLFYFADRMNDSSGSDVGGNFDVFAYAQAPRLIWITPQKFLGGYYGMDVLVPFLYQEVEAGPYNDSEFGLGDIFFEPITLSWHWQQFDAAVGYGIWTPTGDDEPVAPVTPGKGYWSHMVTLGGTWYPDLEKTWSVSILGRYEIHTEQDTTDTTRGDTLSIEGGIGKALSKSFEVGVVGYCQQQVTDDRGTPGSGDLDQVWGLGPEIGYTCKGGVIATARYICELGALGRPQGNTVTLTLTKRF